MASIDDDGYYQDGFQNYVATTTDPGSWMMIGVCLYSISCVLVFLPISVLVGKRCNKQRKNNIQLSTSNGVTPVISNKDNCGGVRHVSDVVVESSTSKEKNNDESSDHLESIDLESKVVFENHSVSWPGILSAISSHIECRRSGQTKEDSSIEDSSIFSKDFGDHNTGAGTRSSKKENIQLIVSSSALFQEAEKELRSSERKNVLSAGDEDISNAISSADMIISVCSSGSPITNNNGKNDDDKDRFNSKSTALYEDKLCSTITKTIRFDNETKRILKLGGPFTVSTVSEAVFDAIIVALISKYLGVEALSAAIVTHLLIGLTDTFVKGVADALNTLCSHAIGTENFNLAGEYVQIAMVTYISISLPVSAAWWFFMDDAIRLFGMNERVVMIGTGYAKVLLADYLTKGMFDVFLALLDVTGYESQATVVVLVEGITSVLSLWALLYFVETMDLFWVGIAELGVSLFIYVMFGIFVVYRGWLDPFWHGMTKTFALKNSSAVKNLLHTAIPLSIGSLLEYGEWEALTFFAAALGPAEVVAWGVLESIWDLFEAATEGLAEAGSMRLAFHLGRGDVQTSKLSCWKTLFLSTILACALSTVFLILSPYIPHWFTNDETLVSMVKVQLPLIGVGNIFMVFGMTSWSLIGAQGRYKIATLISAAMTICVTLPLAAVFCIGMRYSLISLVGAVVVGYSTTGLFLGYFLQMSDWLHVSKIICALNEKDELECSSDDDSAEENPHDRFEDNVCPKSISAQPSPDYRTHGCYNISIKSVQASHKMNLATCPDNVKVELLSLAEEISKQDSNNAASSDKIASLTAKIMDLEAQVQERNSTIERLRGDIRRMQDLYGAELSDLLGRIKQRVRQTSEVLLGSSSSEKSRDISYESSAEEEVQRRSND